MFLYYSIVLKFLNFSNKGKKGWLGQATPFVCEILIRNGKGLVISFGSYIVYISD